MLFILFDCHVSHIYITLLFVHVAQYLIIIAHRVEIKNMVSNQVFSDTYIFMPRYNKVYNVNNLIFKTL